MTIDQLRELLKSGEPVFAGWAGAGAPLAAEVMGRQGYDALILDAQHGHVTWDNMMSLLQATELAGACGLVRVPAVDSAQIMRALDLGAQGIIVPMVSSERQARDVAEAVAYPPKGIRSFGPVRNYYASAGSQPAPLCLVMIETAEAMRNLDAIASTPGVDGLFVGPVDLGLSLGLGLVMEMQAEIFAAIDQIVTACQRAGKFCGSASLGLPYARSLLDRGVQFIAQGSDVGFIRAGAAPEVKTMKAWRQQAS